jgi:hypothetical protein
VKIAVGFDFHGNNPARKDEPFVFNPGTLGLPIQLNVNSRPTVHI